MPSTIITLEVNGQTKELIAQPTDTLLTVLRESLGLMGAKRGCAQGGCGACTVLIDDEPVVACLVPAATADGSSIRTVEGLADEGNLDEIQQAFVDGFATQCGYCTPGMIMSAESLLARNPEPSREDVVEAISGNVCRCTGYAPIISAILDAAERRRDRSHEPASAAIVEETH